MSGFYLPVSLLFFFRPFQGGRPAFHQDELFHFGFKGTQAGLSQILQTPPGDASIPFFQLIADP
jgi:hypothetical protein